MSIEFEILQGSYMEHFKKAKELAMIYPVEHPKRKELETALSELSDKLQKLRVK